ncbi:MAG: ABC transporter substrate-binding protein [Aquincola sp.]|nr:ABC transporter substrate-binding protein [Aquincola sp.]
MNIRIVWRGVALALALLVGTLPAAAEDTAAASGGERKVLHVAFRSAETGFDPSMISDLYSRTVTPHIFEALYGYDHLARPAKFRPVTAIGMPEVSADFKTWTIRIQPGIFFADDPAFKGKRREMVAQDYVYAFQRIADPINKSQLWSWVETFGLVGLNEYRSEVIADKKRFDYDRPIEGVRAIDRHTIQFKLKESRPRFLSSIAGSDLLGAQAREVVEFYGDSVAEHPVGTGPFRLKQWRRSSLIVLERNPDYRDVRYDAEPAADDAEGQAILARLKGRKLPMIDEVHIAIISEAQPFWLSFLNGQLDAIAGQTGSVPGEFITVAMPNGKIAPFLAQRGIQAKRQVNSDSGLVYYNMEDPVVGGYTPDKIALRRALNLAQDMDAEIRTIRRGQAIPAQSPVSPNLYGYDPAFKSENSDYDPARAKALLDMYGYIDRDGDGWRELPDGKPLVIVRSTQPEQVNREFDTLWKKNLDAIGVKTTFNVGKWAEQLKSARAGKLQVWSLASSAADPDGQGAFQRFHGPQAGGQNLARFKNAELDAIYDRMDVLPDGPERLELFRRAKEIAVAYAPYKNTVHRISTDMWYPWVIGFRRPLFWQEWYHMVDIDLSKKPRK